MILLIMTPWVNFLFKWTWGMVRAPYGGSIRYKLPKKREWDISIGASRNYFHPHRSIEIKLPVLGKLSKKDRTREWKWGE
jgi:hypothetical protein